MSEIRVTVEYFAQARVAAGVAREIVVLNMPDIQSLVRALAERHGSQLAALLRSPAIIFAVGERHVAPNENAKLSDGDVVAIIPPISGGRS